MVIGNPTTYRGKSLTWNGRQLMTYGTNASYTYNPEGIRRSKTVNGSTTTFNLVGSTILSQTKGSQTLVFLYDGNGSLIGFKDKSTNKDYFYLKNLQGDIVKIIDTNKTVVATYEYDDWGKLLTAESSLTSIGQLNPFRYRGYYYDDESGFYYLNSRYYDPETGRFINADDPALTLISPTATFDKNLYAYCDNNPIRRIDTSGCAWESIFDVLSLGASIMEVAFNPTDPFAWLGLAGDAVDLIPFVTGVGESVRALKTASRAADKADDLIDTYYNVKKATKGLDLEVHHIVEKRFATTLGYAKTGGKMPSIALDKMDHREFTNAWRSVLEYGNSYSKKEIMQAAIQIYSNEPELLGAAIYTITKYGR